MLDVLRTISKRSSPGTQTRVRSVSKNWRTASVVQGPISRMPNVSAVNDADVVALREILRANTRILDILREKPRAVLRKLEFLKFSSKNRFMFEARAGSIRVEQHAWKTEPSTTVITDGRFTFYLDEGDTEHVYVSLRATMFRDHRCVERLAAFMATYVLAVGGTVAFSLDHNTPPDLYPVLKTALQIQRRTVKDMT